MKKNIYSVFVLLCTAVGGFFLGWKSAKKKYEALADKEVASIKAGFESRIKNEETGKKGNSISPLDETGVKGFSKLQMNEKEKYKNYAGEYRSPDDKPKKYASVEGLGGEGVGVKFEVPCRLTDEEFAESDIESDTLYYFRDRVLADSDYNVIDDVQRTVGDALINLMDEVIVYVRNFEYGKDYEVVIDERSFYEASNRRYVPDKDDDEND